MGYGPPHRRLSRLKSTRNATGCGRALAFFPLILSGWWYRDTVQSGGDSLVSSYGKITGHSPCFPAVLCDDISHGCLFIASVLASYWGAFGSVGDTHLPRVLTVSFDRICPVSLYISVVRHSGSAATFRHDPVIQREKSSRFFSWALQRSALSFFILALTIALLKSWAVISGCGGNTTFHRWLDR